MGLKKQYKLISLLGVVSFPQMPITCDIRRDASKKSIIEASKNHEQIVLVTQTNNNLSSDIMSSINGIGTVCNIRQVIIPSDSNGVLKLEADGIKRAKILNVFNGQFLTADVEEIVEENVSNTTINLLMSATKQHFVEYASFDNRFNPELLRLVGGMEDVNAFVNTVTVLTIKEEKKQLEILNEMSTVARLEKLIGFLLQEIEIANVNKKLSEKVKESMDKSQKEYYLREQMKAISEELGDSADEYTEIENKIKKADMPKEVMEKALKELNRAKKIPVASPDNSVLRGYLDTLLDLPWSKRTVDNKNLIEARKILDEDHAGLEKVKDRIIEYLAVMHLTDKLSGQIICFVGPPGVGKTSVAKSIARALNRNFVKMSVGGVKDESEIRGHRKTYVGAMPGRIIYNMRLAGSVNPVFLIDEIDKMSSDFRGDPTSAMLEVLDPEQNYQFRDNYLEVPFDLSSVMFIATANNLLDIPTPLLDRMEIIELSSYTLDEKFEIAKHYLLPKVTKMHGFKAEQLHISDDIIKTIIEEYTYEAGVRSLERAFASICRKIAVEIVNNPDPSNISVTIDKNNLFEYLGAHKVIKNEKRDTAEIGVVSGLSYSSVGGGVLTVEVNKVNGDGKINLTGLMGDVMQESAKVALSAVIGISNQYDIDTGIFKKYDTHIHVPEGAIKKDGPSAGIALATAIFSAFSNKKIDNNLAMTGEITIRGNVLPIGGLKEKLFACVRAGIQNVIVPEENRDDILGLPKSITENLHITYVNNLKQVLQKAIVE